MTDLRRQLIAVAQAMAPAGLNRGTSGNVSVRSGDGFYITPTGLPYGSLSPDDIPLMALDGSHQGQRKPSSEWRFHRDLYAGRPEVGAVLHAHSPFAVSLACLRRASLKETSLCKLARRLGIEPEAFVRHFIEYERMVRRHDEQ